MTTRLKLLTIAAAVLAAVLTTSASASAGPVNRFLTGGLVDPLATTMRIVPPRGGMVMVHDNGKAVAWLTRAGYVNVKPNRVYGITATRGRTLLFSTNMRVRRGYTEMIWGQGSQPQLSYVPAARWRRPAYAGVRRTPRSRARTRPRYPKRSTRVRMSTRSTTKRTAVKRTAVKRTVTKRTPLRRTVTKRTTTKSSKRSSATRTTTKRIRRLRPTPRRPTTTQKRSAKPAKKASKKRAPATKKQAPVKKKRTTKKGRRVLIRL
jgi:hypothetical protein